MCCQPRFGHILYGKQTPRLVSKTAITQFGLLTTFYARVLQLRSRMRYTQNMALSEMKLQQIIYDHQIYTDYTSSSL